MQRLPVMLLRWACCGILSTPGWAGSALELHGVIVVTRHGDRSALHPVPVALTPGLSDVDRERWIGPPWGDLTTKGEEQHRRLGVRCRCRYSALVGDRYDARKVYARSTASDRTLRSGQAFLVGLFGEPVGCADPAGPYPYPWSATSATDGGLRGTGGGDEIPDATGSTEPLSTWGGNAGRTAALHSVQKEQDTLLRAFDLCPAYEQLLQTVHDGHEWQVKEQLELGPGGTLSAWRDVVDAAGSTKDIEQTWSLWCFVPLFDSINVLLNHGFAHALPTPLTADNGALLHRASKLYHWCRARKYGPAPQLGRISGGLMVAAIRHRLVALAHAVENGGVHEEGEEVEEAGLASDGGPGGAPLTPFTLYSAHDSTLMALCAALGHALNYNPPYASSLAIELWRYRSAAEITPLDVNKDRNSVPAAEEQWYVALTMNGEPLSSAECEALGLESDRLASPAEPVCSIGLEAFLKRTEAVVPDDYDHSKWAFECSSAHASGSDGAFRHVEVRPEVHRASNTLRVLATAVVVVILWLRRQHVMRTLQNWTMPRRLGRH